MKKRYLLFSLLLALAVLLSVMLTVSAETAPEAHWGTSADALTESGTLLDAIAAARYDPSVKYVRLGSDVDTALDISSGNFTLDFAGHTVTSDGYTINVGNIGTELTIVDTVGGGGAYTTDGGCTPLSVSSGCKVTVEGGKFESTGTYSVRVWPYESTTLILNGGTYHGTVDVSENVTVNGGVYHSYFFMMYQDTVLTLNDLTVAEGSDADTVRYYGGKLVVNTDKSIRVDFGVPVAQEEMTESFVLPDGLSLIDKNGNLITQAEGSTLATLGKDTVKPVLDFSKVRRSDAYKADLHLVPSESGVYYYARVPSGATAPTVDTSGAGTPYSASINLSLTDLTEGVGEDVYLVLKDVTGNISDPIKVSVSPYIDYGLNVAGITVNEDNAHDILGDKDGARASARYYHATRTLTLDGFVYTCDVIDVDAGSYGYGVIHSENAITVRLVGESEITLYGTYRDSSGGSLRIDGLYFSLLDGNVSILGDGSLTLQGKGDGIDIISEGSASLTVGERASISMKLTSEGIRMEAENDVALTVKEHARIAIENEEESIDLRSHWGEVRIHFKDNARYYSTTSDEEGIYANAENSYLTVSDNAHVTVDGDEEGVEVLHVTLSGGYLSVYGKEDYEGIFCATLTVTDGTLVVDNGVGAETITITDGTVIVRGREEGSPVLSVAPDLSGYEGEHRALASLFGENTDLIPYFPVNNDTYSYFILAPEGTKVIWPVYGESRAAPILTAEDSYVLPPYDGASPTYSVFDGWQADGVAYKVGDTLPLPTDVTLHAAFKVVSQQDPVINLAKRSAFSVYTEGGETFFYDYDLGADIPYTGTLTFTGFAENGFIDVYEGTYTFVFDGVTFTGEVPYPYLTLDTGTYVTLTLKGKNRLVQAECVPLIGVAQDAELAIVFTENASLNLAIGFVNDTSPESAESFSIALLKAENDGETDARLTLSSPDGTHLTAVSAKGESYLDAPTAAELDALCSERAFKISAHAFSRIEKESVKKSNATCTVGATYYLSCEHCSRVSEETFVSETLAPHAYADGVCTVCGANDPEGDSLLWLWILLPSVTLAGGGAALYFFVFRKRFG